MKSQLDLAKGPSATALPRNSGLSQFLDDVFVRSSAERRVDEQAIASVAVGDVSFRFARRRAANGRQ